MKTYLALIFSGAVLLALEIFLPGGVAGFIGVMILIGAAFVAVNTVGGWMGVGLAILALLVGCLMTYLVIKIFPRSFVGRNLSLDADLSESHAENAELSALIGVEGVSSTVLRPAGFAELKGQRIDVVTRGEVIEANVKVRVVDVEGNRVVVVKV